MKIVQQFGKTYSILKCKPVQGIPWNYGNSLFQSHGFKPQHKASPHYHLIGLVDDGTQYTIVINIESRDQAAPMLLYYIDTDFKHEITDKMMTGMDRYEIIHPESAPDGLSLDYVRGGLFDYHQMVLENTTPDGQDSLNKVIDDYVKQAIREGAYIYAFGQEYIDVRKGNGIHDIHMNQGNEPWFSGEDGVYQDGGMFIHFQSSDKWVVMFLAFQSQSFHTDPRTGHRLD